MSRIFTMRRCCRFCSTWFTINGSNHWFCGYSDCTSRRRKAERQAAKQRSVKVGSDAHLARAIKTGE
jgi:hypothetical protein